jgi:signal transduction histidine kinase
LKSHGPSLRTLLLGVNALVLALPIAAVITLRVYDTYLVRQTERSLIAQSVVIGEIYRERLHEEQGKPAEPGTFRPPERSADAFIPIEPVLDFTFHIERKPPVAQPMPARAVSDDAARRAGARMEALLKRAQVFNLTGIRILDGDGCVVSTSRTEGDVCMNDLPEVQTALHGRYGAVARERVSDEPTPALGDVRSRGKIRIFSALPVFEDGKVIAIVRSSRTSTDALTSLWQSRRGLLIAIVLSFGVTLGISAMFATFVVRPVKALTNDAIAITNDAARLPLRLRWWTPHELRTLSAALDVMTTTLRERADYIAAFAATVSHELKTPITAIRGAAELLTDQWATMSEAQREKFLRNIDFDAERMQRLVTRLLHLARIENAGEAHGETRIREAIDTLTARHGERVRVTIDADVPPTIAMPDELFTSAVGNLVDNAVRHGGQELVEMRVRVDGQHLRIDIIDKGAGISPANQTKIFERFFTTERAGGGTGLGLTIVRAIARRRGGDVTFVTGPTGTTFTLTL